MKTIIFCTLLFFLLIPASTFAHPNKSEFSLTDSSGSSYKKACMETLEALHASFNGVTKEGNPYKVYAIKVKKDWTFLIADSISYYSIQKTKGRDTISENTQNFTDLLVMMIKAKLIKQVGKPKNVSGITLSCYYKFKPNAKSMYKSVTKLEKKALLINKEVKTAGGIFKFLKPKLE